MALGGSFKADHPYATGLLLIVVAGFGIAGSVTGQLAAMLAALWVPSALVVNESSGGGANSSSGPTTSGGNNPYNNTTAGNPVNPVGGSLIPGVSV